MIFSSRVFALQVEAPVEKASFSYLIADEKIKNHFIKDQKNMVDQVRINKIRSYYNRYNLPLAAHAEDFVRSANKYDIDWRLVAAIGMIESTGGKFACSTAKYSAFGWGSCKIDFDSYEQSIDVISKNLAGKNPNTSHYYAGKDIRGILWSYNPDTIRAGYGDMVMRQMEIIDQQ